MSDTDQGAQRAAKTEFVINKGRKLFDGIITAVFGFFLGLILELILKSGTSNGAAWYYVSISIPLIVAGVRLLPFMQRPLARNITGYQNPMVGVVAVVAGAYFAGPFIHHEMYPQEYIAGLGPWLLGSLEGAYARLRNFFYETTLPTPEKAQAFD